MRKYLALLLVLLPILAGCMNQEPEQSQSTTLPLATLPPAYYEANSAIEAATDGAVKQYALPGNSYSGLYSTGNCLLLETKSEHIQLQVLTGETCIPSAALQLEQTDIQQYRAVSNGFAYYDGQSNAVRYLDTNLNQRHSVALTGEMTSPVISPDGDLIFYCCGNEIRALDVEKNISRLVRTQAVAKQTLLGTCFEGNVLICSTEDETGKAETQYISVNDGRTLRTENGISCLYSDEEEYVALWADGVVEQWICGAREGAAQRFVINDAYVFDAMELGGIVGYSAGENGLCLNFYTMPAAKRTSEIVLENVDLPDLLLADQWSGCIWMVANDPQGQGKVLLKWDMEKSRCNDETVYTEVLYTASNPNKEALKEIQKRVEQLNTKHGVRIRIWEEAVGAPGEHVLVAEHQPEAITEMLDQLESVLNEFPKKFLYNSISSRLRICLIRSIDGQQQGKQYWEGRYAFVTLCSGSDVREDFLKGFGIVVDSHVLGNSPIYDYWETLNPEGFRYGKPDESFVTGDIRYFVDIDSMTSGMIDRARIFWQAMQPENAELFRTEVMQKKLTMLCKAIRDAWRLEKKTDVYPWEQYLEEPIARKK